MWLTRLEIDRSTMEDLYRNIVLGAGSSTVEGFHHHFEGSSYDKDNNINDDDVGLEELDGGKVEAAAESDNMSDLVKSQIATHPLYPKLLSAYISCQKVINLHLQFIPCNSFSSISYVPRSINNRTRSIFYICRA